MNKELHPTIQAVITNIKSIRKEKGYSQDYLAAKLGITQNAYSKIELGKTSVAISKLYKIAATLEVDVMQLLEVEHSGDYRESLTFGGLVQLGRPEEIKSVGAAQC